MCAVGGDEHEVLRNDLGNFNIKCQVIKKQFSLKKLLRFIRRSPKNGGAGPEPIVLGLSDGIPALTW